MFKIGDMVYINKKLAKDESYKYYSNIRRRIVKYGVGPFKIKKIEDGEFKYYLDLKEDILNEFSEKEIILVKPPTLILTKLKKASQNNNK
jgi:hypothetical protein